MLSKWFGKDFYHKILFTGYLGLAVGLPLSKIILSLSTLWIVLLVLLEADFKTYAKNLRRNKSVLFLVAFLILHLLSFLWSSDLNFALKDLNAKLPLYAVILAFVAQPLQSSVQKVILLGAFLLSVTLTSFFNFGSYQHWWGNHVYDDIRGMSLFLSHIRYSLMITMAAAITMVWLSRKNLPFRGIALILFLWFGFYTYYAQILSGVMTFVGVLITWLILELVRLKNKKLSFSVIGLGAIVTSLAIYALIVFFKPQELKISLKKLPWKTEQGNRYYYDWGNLSLENGYPLYYFLCQQEMRIAWNERSQLDYDSTDLKGQDLESTIIRYVTSKGLYKDAAGINQLSDEDIRNIERGIPTIVGLEGGFLARLAGLKRELFEDADPNGQSVTQRFIYWKTGWKIIQENWVLGVGSGDIEQKFQDQYVKDHSPLRQEYRLRTHNQFMSYTITFGVIGLIIFLGFIGYFCLDAFRRGDKLALMFIVIAVLSFLVEDTLETQMGVTFFAFFFGLFAQTRKNLQSIDIEHKTQQ